MRLSTNRPFLAAVTGPARPDGTDAVVVSGWLAGPGPRPQPRATLDGRPGTVRLEPFTGTVPGLPPDWTVWRWHARAGTGSSDQLCLVLTGPDGRLLVSRDVRRDGTLVPAPAGSVDNPAPDSVVDGDLVAVTGWLLLDDAPPARIEVDVDGGEPVTARLMIPRPDLAESLPGVPNAPLAGFEARVPVPLASGESRRVRVRAWTRDGRVWLAPPRECTMRNPAATPADEAVARQAGTVLTRLLAATPATPDPRHVFVVAHSLRVGGGELWLGELLRRLAAEHGLRITLVAPTDGPLRRELESHGVAVRLLGERRIQDVASYHTYLTELSLLMRASGAGVVLVNTLGFFAGVDAARRAGLPVAWAIHESFALPDFAYLNWGPAGLAPVVRQRWMRCLAEADALVFVADATRELFAPHTDPRRCLTIRYGVDTGYLAGPGPDSVATLRNRLGVPAGARVLLNVGVSEPRKGHGPLLVAFETVARRHPDTHLVIVGMYDSPYCEALRDRVRRARLSDRVSLVPITRDPLPWFRIADLFVNCSDIESLPRTILEAIALRLPVVAADVFGARELIVDGDSSWLFRPNDLTALTVGLLRALDTPQADRARFAEQARERVAPFLDSAGYGTEFAKLLATLGDATSGGSR